MTPHLHDIAKAPPEIRWQWHADFTWTDPFTGRPESYLAGFRTRPAAVEYGARHGWRA